MELKISQTWKDLEKVTDGQEDDFDIPRAELVALADKLREYNEKFKTIFGSGEDSDLTDEFQTYIMNIEDSVTVADFNVEWEEFYNFCDQKRIWIDILSPEDEGKNKIRFGAFGEDMMNIEGDKNPNDNTRENADKMSNYVNEELKKN